MTTTNRLSEVAYHEAGHAAIHLYLDVPFDLLSINPDQGAEGWIAYPPLTDPLQWEQDEAERDLLIDKHVMTLFAGPLAQQRHCGNYDTDGAGGDHDTIRDLAFIRCSSGDEVDAYLAWMGIRTRNLINMCWPQIEAIAQALLTMKELSFDEVVKIVNRPSGP